MIEQLRDNAHFRRLITAIILFIISLTIGIVGFILIEDMNTVDSIYMTIITVSTVGFTEVKELTPSGRIFTSIYIIFNVTLFAYILTVVSNYFFEGRLNEILKNLRSNMKLNKLNDHVIVCGYGRNGRKACKELAQSGQDFIIIDKDESIADKIPKPLKWFIGDATKDEDLKMIGIERASAIIITTPSDSVNVFVTLTARNLNPTIKIIARTSSEETQDKLYHAGANFTVRPDALGGMFMAHMITKPIVIEFLNLINGTSGLDYHLEEIDYKELKDEFKDRALTDLNILERTGAVVIGVKDDIKGIIPAPAGQTVVGKEDHLILLGSTICLQKFAEIYRRK
ncbi:potassium channel family protein [Ekhidna sp. To15]|uniref:potassium channel family protein n=1 Tax=Ekhidna sp. To15 TaxID=3395267 RepID=UPI003F520E7A